MSIHRVCKLPAFDGTSPLHENPKAVWRIIENSLKVDIIIYLV